MTKESGVSVEFTTFGFDRDKEKDMKDIPAGTYVGNRMVYPWVSDDAYDHHLYLGWRAQWFQGHLPFGSGDLLLLFCYFRAM